MVDIKRLVFSVQYYFRLMALDIEKGNYMAFGLVSL